MPHPLTNPAAAQSGLLGPGIENDPRRPGPGLLQKLGAAGQGLLDTAQFVAQHPGKRFTGEAGPERDIEFGATAAELMAGGGLASAARRGGSSVGTFGGKLAKTADHRALEIAEGMERAGASPQDIWKATGWAKAKGGDWQFKISDDALEFDPSLIPQKGTVKFPEVASHPLLEQAHPSIRDLNVGKSDFLGFGAQFQGGSDTVRIGGRNVFESTPFLNNQKFLHEVQHGVQSREGFARGTNPQSEAVSAAKTSAPDSAAALNVQIQMLKNKRRTAHGGEKDQIDLIIRETEKRKRTFQEIADESNDATYRRFAGEEAAREVERQYLFKPPFSEEIPRHIFNQDQQILGFRGNPSLLRKRPPGGLLR